MRLRTLFFPLKTLVPAPARYIRGARDDNNIKWMCGILCLIILLCLAVGCKPSEPQPKPLVSGKYQDIAGKTVDFEALRGKWIVVNYWASWCKPCFVEIPELNLFYKTYKNKNVVLLGVSFDPFDSTKQLEMVVKKMKIQFPVLTTNPATGLGIRQPAGLPATYIINPKGEVEKELLGMQTLQTLKAAIGEL